MLYFLSVDRARFRHPRMKRPKELENIRERLLLTENEIKNISGL